MEHRLTSGLEMRLVLPVITFQWYCLTHIWHANSSEIVCNVNIASFNSHIQGSPLIKRETFNLVKYKEIEVINNDGCACSFWRRVDTYSPQTTLQLVLWVPHIIMYVYISGTYIVGGPSGLCSWYIANRRICCCLCMVNPSFLKCTTSYTRQVRGYVG